MFDESAEAYFQLIYVSSAAAMFTDEQLPLLLAQARKNNEKLGVTGMLLFHERSFIQVLTGPEQVVLKLYEKITQDPRHKNPRILFNGPVSERSFEDWSMGFCNTKTRTARELPGFSNVLNSGFSCEQIDADRAKRVLASFRDGQWRQAVNG